MSKFMIGRLCASRGVADCMAENRGFERFVQDSLARYFQCDWGETTAADKRSNDEAVTVGDERILAAYHYPGRSDLKIWIITEADRSATTVIFPSEY